MSTYLLRVWYTITTNSDLADMALARFRSNGMVAGKVDLLYTGKEYHAYMVGGIWLSDDDYSGRQLDDHEFMSNNSTPEAADLNFFQTSTVEKQFLCRWIRRCYPPFIGHAKNGPRPILDHDIWNELDPYVANPDSFTWSYMSINVFTLDQ